MFKKKVTIFKIEFTILSLLKKKKSNLILQCDDIRRGAFGR